MHDLARRNRNQNPEHFPQRRKGRKEIKLPDLAFLAPWREQVPFWIARPSGKILRKLQRLSTIAMYRLLSRMAGSDQVLASRLSGNSGG
jgi:hypothetical protein